MRTQAHCIVAGLALLLGACSEASPSAAEEVAGELRALRMALAQQAQAVGAPPSERVDVATALAPLRTVLDTLATSQRELAERQVALAQEMQRWSQLLVESVAGARVDEAKAMTRRLGELEARLEQQNARHREVEVLLQGALERTADQLDGFLKRLDTIGPVRRTDGAGSSDAASPPGPGTPSGGSGANGNASNGNAPNGNASGGSAAGGNGERASGMLGKVPGGMVLEPAPKPSLVDGILRHRAPASRWWWLALTVLGLGVATLCLRRSRRSPPAERPVPLPAGTEGLPAAAERSVDEIWAAAALLGEAVGRLRQQAGMAEPGAPVAVASMPLPGSLDDEALVWLGDPGEEPQDAGMPMAPPTPLGETAPAVALPPAAPPPVSHVPATPEQELLPPVDSASPLETVVAQLPGGSLDRDVLAALASERSVLRRPAPAIERRGQAVAVRFHPVPGTTPADQARLLQRLRDALRPRGSSAD